MLYIILGLGLIAQTAITVLAIRYLMNRRLGDAYDSGKLAGSRFADAFAETYRVGYDIGLERGHSDGYDQAITDSIENPETFTARLLEIRPGAGQ